MIVDISDFNQSQWTRRLALVLIMLSLLAVCWVEGTALFDRYAVNEDMRNYYWMARFQDPSLFANDPLATDVVTDLNVLGHTVVVYFRSLGYSLLFYLLSFVIEPIWVSKLLVFVLMPLSVVYVFGLGRLLRDNVTGLLLTLLYIFFIMSSPSSVSLITGLQRAFTMPLLVAFLYYLLRLHYWAAAGVVVLGGLFYLPVLPITALTYAFSFVRIDWPVKVTWQLSRHKVVPFLVAIVVSAALVAPAFLVEVQASATNSESQQVRILDDPMYQKGGRAALFTVYPLLGRAGILDEGWDVLNNLVLLLTVICIWAVVGNRSLRLNVEVWYLLLSGLVLALASWFTISVLSSFLLYYPSRFTRGTIFLFTLCFIAWNLPDFVRSVALSLRRNVRRLVWFLIGLEVILIVMPLLALDRYGAGSMLGVSNARTLLPMLGGVTVLVGVALLARSSPPQSHGLQFAAGRIGRVLTVTISVMGVLMVVVLAALYMYAVGHGFLEPSADERALYEFLHTLPKDTLLAGEPGMMSSVPLFAKRPVLFSTEDIGGNDQAILDFFDAYYAETADAAGTFCRQYGVDYLVVNQGLFTQEYLAQRRVFFFEPYNDHIVAAVTWRTDFALNNIPDDRKLFQSGPLFVVKCDEEMFANLD
jgi:hypothetical protein